MISYPSRRGAAFLTLVTPDLIRGLAFSSDKRFKQIAPLGIAPFDQIEFPLPMPTLDPLLMANALGDIVTTLRPNEPVEPVPGTKI